MMETDDEQTQLRYAQALADWADVGGYDAETLWDVCTVGRARRAVRAGAVPRGAHAVRRRAEAARAGGAAARPRRGAAARRAGQLPRRAGQALARGAAARDAQDGAARLATTASCWPGPPTRIVTLEPGAAGRPSWMHGGGFATYHAGPRGPERAARGAAPALGRGARQAQGAGARCTRPRRRTTTAWPRGTRRRRPGCAKFEEAGPPQAAPREQNVRDAAARRPHRQAGGGLRASWS